MRKIMFGAATAVLLFFVGTTCMAQRLPPGDYMQTCRDMRTSGSSVRASCQKRDGSWRTSTLDYRSCNGGAVINDNGNLRCGGSSFAGENFGGRRRGWDGGLPPGDYKQTCRDMRISGNRLDASCQKRDGGWRNTSLNNVDYCSTRIVNDNGRLNCQR